MEKNKCGAYEIYLLSVLTWVTVVIRWSRNLYGFCFNFFISLVLRSTTWKDVCVCRCSALTYQFSPLQKQAVALCDGVNTWAGLKLPVHCVRMHLLSPLSLISLELHPPPHLPQSTFASLVVAAHFYQGLGFALVGAGTRLHIFFSHPLAGMVGTLLHFFVVSLLLHLLPVCLLFFLECWLQCVPGSPHYKFMSFSFFWLFHHSCERWQLMSTDLQNPFLSLCGILWTTQ